MEADIGMMHPQGTPRNASIARGWEQTRFSPKAFRMERGSADNLIFAQKNPVQISDFQNYKVLICAVLSFEVCGTVTAVIEQ